MDRDQTPPGWEVRNFPVFGDTVRHALCVGRFQVNRKIHLNTTHTPTRITTATR